VSHETQPDFEMGCGFYCGVVESLIDLETRTMNNEQPCERPTAFSISTVRALLATINEETPHPRLMFPQVFRAQEEKEALPGIELRTSEGGVPHLLWAQFEGLVSRRETK
jgi:hypothetical protein